MRASAVLCCIYSLLNLAFQQQQYSYNKQSDLVGLPSYQSLSDVNPPASPDSLFMPEEDQILQQEQNSQVNLEVDPYSNLVPTPTPNVAFLSTSPPPPDSSNHQPVFYKDYVAMDNVDPGQYQQQHKNLSDTSTYLTEEEIQQQAVSFAQEACVMEMLGLNYGDTLTALKNTGVVSEIPVSHTLLVPTNEAMRSFSDSLDINFEHLFLFEANFAAIQEIMRLHVLKQFLSYDDMNSNNVNKVETMLDSQFLEISQGGIRVANSMNNLTASVISSIQNCSVSIVVISQVLLPAKSQ